LRAEKCGVVDWGPITGVEKIKLILRPLLFGSGR
jgi:hypothetical protein